LSFDEFTDINERIRISKKFPLSAWSMAGIGASMAALVALIVRKRKKKNELKDKIKDEDDPARKKRYKKDLEDANRDLETYYSRLEKKQS